MRLREDGAPWTLRVCGEGRLRGDLERRISECGLTSAVTFEGYVPYGAELLGHYRRSDALIVPSRGGEGVPQTIVEALAAGLPVVTTDVGGIRAAFGQHVSFVPSGDAVRMAAAVDHLRRDPGMRQRMADGGRNAVRAHTLQAEAARLGDFLADAVGP